MSKHVIDQPRDRGGARLAQFVKIQRASVCEPFRKILQRRPRQVAVARVPAYLRIARQAR